MQFPAPSETFASNDFKSLKNLNIDVDIYSLKNKHKDFEKLVTERDLNSNNIYHISKQNILHGIYESIKNIFLLIDLLVWIIRSDYKRPNFLLKTLACIPAAFLILKRLKKRKPNIVHLFWGHYPCVVAYLVHKKLKNTKISIFLGAYDLEYSLGISRSICKISDYVFTHTCVNIPKLEKLGVRQEKINTIYRGTVIEKSSSSNTKKSNTFCTGGRLLKSKNFEKVIEVFYEYQLKIPNSKLTIFGDGPNKKDLIELTLHLNIQDKVDFIGFITQEEVLEVLSSTEYFLFFSIKKGERLPNVLKEAMLKECIVCSSYSPGLEELIVSEKNGFILNDLSTNKIVDLLLDIKQEEKNKLRYNAKDYIISNFNVLNCMKKYLSIWKERL